MDNLGTRLKKARENKRMTQQEVAKILGVSNGAISGYERNYRDPDTETLKKLAQLYEVSVDYLTGSNISNIIKESGVSYNTEKEKQIVQEKLKLADMILNLPEHEKNLVIDMVKTLKDKNKNR